MSDYALFAPGDVPVERARVALRTNTGHLVSVRGAMSSWRAERVVRHLSKQNPDLHFEVVPVTDTRKVYA